MTEADKLLILRAQQGDAQAFEALYQQHLKRVYNIAWRMMGNDADAQDIAQEVMLKAWRALPAFKLDSTLSTWLYRIAVNACSDELRRRRTKTVSVEVLTDTGHEPGDSGFEQNVAMGESLSRAIGALPNEYRSAVVLRDVQGYSYEEIAEILNCPIGTVRSRINRAREQLRRLIDRGGGTFVSGNSSKLTERDRT